MFRQSTLPSSITWSRGGSGLATAAVSAAGPSVSAASAAGFGGQNVAATSGRSKTERKTLRPSMMLERSFGSMVSQSCAYQRRIASRRSRRAGSTALPASTSNAIPCDFKCSGNAGSQGVRTTSSPAGSHRQAARAAVLADSSSLPMRTPPGGSTSASTSAIFRSIRSGSSVERYTSRSVTQRSGAIRCSSMIQRTRLTYACCQNGSFERPKSWLMRLATV